MGQQHESVTMAAVSLRPYNFVVIFEMNLQLRLCHPKPDLSAAQLVGYFNGFSG